MPSQPVVVAVAKRLRSLDGDAREELVEAGRPLEVIAVDLAADRIPAFPEKSDGRRRVSFMPRLTGSGWSPAKLAPPDNQAFAIEPSFRSLLRRSTRRCRPLYAGKSRTVGESQMRNERARWRCA